MTSTTRTAAPPRHGVRASSGTTQMWLMDEVGAWGVTASQFTADLRTANGGPVELYVSSPGGDVFDGLAMYEALRQHPGRTTAYVTGLAASAASVIVCGADEVIMAPAAMEMVHEASCMAFGSQDDHLASAALLGQVSDTIAGIYAARAGGTAASWRATMKAETWFTASEAVAASLADRVADAPALGDPVARLDRMRAQTGIVFNAAGLVREAMREVTGTSLLGVPLARPSVSSKPRPGRRPAPSALATLRALKAARR